MSLFYDNLSAFNEYTEELVDKIVSWNLFVNGLGSKAPEMQVANHVYIGDDLHVNITDGSSNGPNAKSHWTSLGIVKLANLCARVAERMITRTEVGEDTMVRLIGQEADLRRQLKLKYAQVSKLWLNNLLYVFPRGIIAQPFNMDQLRGNLFAQVQYSQLQYMNHMQHYPYGTQQQNMGEQQQRPQDPPPGFNLPQQDENMASLLDLDTGLMIATESLINLSFAPTQPARMDSDSTLPFSIEELQRMLDYLNE